jgi:hypothetical protein
VNFRFYANGSTASSFSCLLNTSLDGVDGGGVAGTIASVTLTAAAANRSLPLVGPLSRAWFSCASIADNQVTIRAIGCTQ